MGERRERNSSQKVSFDRKEGKKEVTLVFILGSGLTAFSSEAPGWQIVDLSARIWASLWAEPRKPDMFPFPRRHSGIALWARLKKNTDEKAI